MQNLFWWIVFGAAFGFYRAWKKTKPSYDRAMQIIESVPPSDRNAKAHSVGYTKGLRATVLATYTAIGAVIGAAIWGAATALVAVIQ